MEYLNKHIGHYFVQCYKSGLDDKLITCIGEVVDICQGYLLVLTTNKDSSIEYSHKYPTVGRIYKNKQDADKYLKDTEERLLKGSCVELVINRI